MRTERFRGALLSTLMIISLIALAIPLLSPSPVHAALTPHAPILINGNGGFTSPDPVNGGGSGAENDPYIIENWIINASTAHGIEIRNTTDYFVVRNCMVENGGGAYDGILLYDVVNGRIENNTCGNNRYGIHLNRSDVNTLTNNTCKNNEWEGIYLDISDNNTLDNNICSNNDGDGIDLGFDSSNNILTNNTCKNNSGGIDLRANSNNNLVSNNTCENNYYGIYLWHSDNNRILNNLVENNYYGIVLEISSNNLISNNLVGNNSSDGIDLWNSSNNNIVENNIVENHYAGILLSFSNNNLVSNNTCENNYYGIYLWHSDNNRIYHNNLTNNTDQAYDDGTNTWDNDYPSGGNYWSDYAGVDNYRGENQDLLGSDGIGDALYNISGDSNQDRYPLMNPWPVSHLGTAAFSMLDIYTVNVEKILELGQGSKLVVKFYTYGDAFENENVIENFSPPLHVEENEEARHPAGLGVRKVRLDLTTDNTENVISTIASFTVRRVTLEERFMEIPFYWSQADAAGKLALEAEFLEIPFYWSQAPS